MCAVVSSGERRLELDSKKLLLYRHDSKVAGQIIKHVLLQWDYSEPEREKRVQCQDSKHALQNILGLLISNSPMRRSSSNKISHIIFFMSRNSSSKQ